MRHELLTETQAQPVCLVPKGQFRLVGEVGKPSPATRYLATYELPRGTQARLMQAAAFSQAIGHPVNAMLTINAAHLQRIGEGGIFGIGHLCENGSAKVSHGSGVIISLRAA